VQCVDEMATRAAQEIVKALEALRHEVRACDLVAGNHPLWSLIAVTIEDPTTVGACAVSTIGQAACWNRLDDINRRSTKKDEDRKKVLRLLEMFAKLGSN